MNFNEKSVIKLWLFFGLCDLNFIFLISRKNKWVSEYYIARSCIRTYVYVVV